MRNTLTVSYHCYRWHWYPHHRQCDIQYRLLLPLKPTAHLGCFARR